MDKIDHIERVIITCKSLDQLGIVSDWIKRLDITDEQQKSLLKLVYYQSQEYNYQ